MFEFSIIRRYLIPKRKQLSVTLISLMSVGVIALVVWLVLVFLSVTEGIERSWLEKLTSLNAPLRITPTEAYYNSYYYQADSFSHASHYRSKTLGEKLQAETSDPYNPGIDPELPPYAPTPDFTGKDPVKTAFQILENCKKEHPDLAFQEYELGGAMLRLKLLRHSPVQGQETQSFLTQVSYLASFADQSPYMRSLVLPPRMKDLNHLFFLSNYSPESVAQDTPEFAEKAYLASFRETLERLLPHLSLHTVRTKGHAWRISQEMLPEKREFSAIAYFKEGEISQIVLPLKEKKVPPSTALESGLLLRENHTLIFNGKPVALRTPLFIEDSLEMKASLISSSFQEARQLRDLKFAVQGTLQGQEIKGELPWEGVEIAKAETVTSFEAQPKTSPFWIYRLKEQGILPKLPSREQGILIAKSFQESGVMMGDRGYLAYQAATPSGTQEQRLPVYIAGFYDPGIMSVGSKCILVPQSTVHTINTASQMHHFDQTLSNGIQVWFKNIKEAPAFRHKLEAEFQKLGIDQYWKVTTYHDYDFAKDLLQQFQSDRYLFTLIGIIILTVACCNIISLLVILVNDKKKEIGILQAMGASPRSIALIFGGCGALMGICSSLIGILAATFTLKNLDGLVHFLSAIQGHTAFNSAFYGASLPNHLSQEALYFVLIATPLISLLAGLVPAIKACRLRPSEILRSE